MHHTQNCGLVVIAPEIQWLTLKRKYRHYDDISNAGYTGICHFDDLQLSYGASDGISSTLHFHSSIDTWT